MALTREQQIDLIRTYAPIVFFHRDERFFPIKPQTYIGRSALWTGDKTGRKEGWGDGPPGFPRKPLIPRPGISLNPAEDFEGTKDPHNNGVGGMVPGPL